MQTQDKWNLKKVKAEQAIALLSGDDGAPNWRDIRIAHLDTGYTHHPVFGAWPNGRNAIINVDEGVNYVDPAQGLPHDPLDYVGFPGHGTRTSSVLAASLPGTFIGVARGAPVVPYRVTNSVHIGRTNGVARNVARAIRDAVDRSSCEVVSISLGRLNFPGRTLGKAVDYAYESGTIICAAAGQPVDRVVYPAKYKRTIAVGGTTPKDRIWQRYESYERIDTWAPADEVWRANTVLVNDQETYDHYKPGDGTSYATVHVSGAAAMWLAYHGDDIDRSYPLGWQRIEAFRSLLLSTQQPLKGKNPPSNAAGILNIHALLTAPLPDRDDLAEETDRAEDDIA